LLYPGKYILDIKDTDSKYQIMLKINLL